MDKKNSYKITVNEEQVNQRIDSFISSHINQTRNFVQKLIGNSNVLVNGKAVKYSYKIREKDILEIDIPDPVELDTIPENIPINILYQDKDLVVIDKAAGMVVHPGCGNYTGTLVNALLFHIKDLSGIGGVFRPGIVHRLDKDTSGVMVVAKNDKAHNHLAKQFKDHTIKREYRGFVYGSPKEDEGRIEKEIGRAINDRKKYSIKTRSGKSALTTYKVIYRYAKAASFCSFVLGTGRTHQIRVHMASLGHPIVSDSTYGKGTNFFRINHPKYYPIFSKLKRQALHAYVLGFEHPGSGEYLEFRSELPEDMKHVLEKLNKLHGSEF
ncbi:MAG: RluA family pseudouridine synthase [Pseudomonadota bacterium]